MNLYKIICMIEKTVKEEVVFDDKLTEKITQSENKKHEIYVEAKTQIEAIKKVVDREYKNKSATLVFERVEELTALEDVLK